LAPYLESVIDYLKLIGFYDILLPFILVFTIVYSILEKTEILGHEMIAGKSYPRRSINMIAAFSIAMITVASSQIVGVINKALGPIVVAILISVFTLMFLILFGREIKDDPVVKYYSYALVVILALIIIWAAGWLPDVVKYFETNKNAVNIIGIVVLFGVIALLILWITDEPLASAPAKKKDDE